MVDFVRRWSDQSGLAICLLVAWLGLAASKYHDGGAGNGRANEPMLGPTDHWWKAGEAGHPDVPSPISAGGLRRLAFMMLDRDCGGGQSGRVYRCAQGRRPVGRWNGRSSLKGTGFQQPIGAHEHWHVDISYINIAGTFYYLCSVLDGYSRSIVHWDLRERMTEADVEIILQAAREQFPGATPRIISDNGPQFLARDFKAFIRLCGMTHVRTSPYYPQSNGKLERWHKSLKHECIRPGTPLSPEDARRIIGRYVTYYNTVRLHSAIGYVTPADKLAGREPAIFAERDRKLEAARQRRQTRRQACKEVEPGMVAQPA